MSNDNVKNINVGQCVGTIFACLFACLIVFVPFNFGEAGFKFFKDAMPILGDGSYESTHFLMTSNFLQAFNLNFQSVFELLSRYVPYIFFGIIAIDIVMALLLIIFQLTFFRVLFKIISIIFAFAMLGVALYYVIYIVGFILPILNVVEPVNIMTHLEASGILYALVIMIFAFSFIGKQFKWFAKLY